MNFLPINELIDVIERCKRDIISYINKNAWLNRAIKTHYKTIAERTGIHD
jgi:Leu/Phe-tRNA-protein transferase